MKWSWWFLSLCCMHPRSVIWICHGRPGDLHSEQALQTKDHQDAFLILALPFNLSAQTIFAQAKRNYHQWKYKNRTSNRHIAFDCFVVINMCTNQWWWHYSQASRTFQLFQHLNFAVTHHGPPLTLVSNSVSCKSGKAPALAVCGARWHITLAIRSTQYPGR